MFPLLIGLGVLFAVTAICYGVAAAKEPSTPGVFCHKQIFAIFSGVSAALCVFALLGAFDLAGLGQWFVANKLACLIATAIFFALALGMTIWCHNDDRIVEHQAAIFAGLTTLFFEVLLACILAMLGIGTAWAGEAGQGGTSVPSGKTETDVIKVTYPVDLTLEQIQDAYGSEGYGLVRESLPSMDEERTSKSGLSDALTLPLNNTSNAEKAKAEVTYQIRHNPVYLEAILLALKDQKLSDGTTVGDKNPWIQEFLSSCTSARSTTVQTQSGSTITLGISKWLVYDTDGTTVLVSEDYRRVATSACALVNCLVAQGFAQSGEYESTKNWCLDYTGDVQCRRPVEAGYQEDEACLILAFVQKDGTVQFMLGINNLDKRPELLKKKEQQQQTDSDSGGSSTGGSSSGGGGGGGGDNPSPGPNPDPDPEYNKDPSQDPVNQGNAQKGGGSNLPTDGTGEYEATPKTEKGQTGGSSTSSSGSSSSNTSGSSTAPATDPIPVTHDTTVTDKATGQTTNTSEEQPSDGVIAEPE